MVPTNEMLEAWFEELHHVDGFDKLKERAWFWNGVAALAHLQSPASEEWKREHGFLEKGE